MLERLVDDDDLGLRFLVARLGLLLQGNPAPLQTIQIGQHQLGLDDIGIAAGIDTPLDVRDVGILKAAQHIGDGIDLADMRQELVSEALALRCAANQARDIDECQARRNDLLALADRRQLVEPRIGHSDLADVRFDRAERIIGCLGRRGLRQRVEKSGFTDVRKSHDSALEAHENLYPVRKGNGRTGNAEQLHA